MQNNKLIVVLGMHRSGTSAITRGLRVMGVELGDMLMPPIENNNPKGFWEDLDIFALNVEILSAIDNDWCCLRPISEPDIETLHEKGYFDRAIGLLRQKVGNTPIFGIKDPRISKLLPFWKEVFSCCQFDVSYVLALRHPLSVASSLAKRDGFEIEYSYLLWLSHVITSLANSNGHNRVLVDYDRLMQSPDHELGRVAKCTGLEIDSVELDIYNNEFLEQGLRHTIYDLNDLVGDSCPPVVREIYIALLDGASGKIGLDDLESKVATWIDEFSRLKSLFLLIDRLAAQKFVAIQAANERDGHIANLTQAWAERDKLITNLTQALAERDGQMANLTQVLADRDGQVINLTQSLEELDRQATKLNQLITKRNEQIATLYSTLSWRITSPLRFISRLFKK